MFLGKSLYISGDLVGSQMAQRIFDPEDRQTNNP